MTTSRRSLSGFLLSVIAEDESVARNWPNEGEWGPHSPGLMWVDSSGHPIWAPRQRVLADCEAKRRIVELHSSHSGPYVPVDWSCVDGQEDAGDPEECQTLRLLALPYSQHPAYRSEWRA